jgi:hypothetical protein
MKTVLFCANYNGILGDNVRASFKHAAERWGAEYFEANEANHPIKLHPATVKLEPFTLTDADAAFIIDCDAIISAAAPNPFETLPQMFCAGGMSPRIDPDGQLQWCGVQHEWRDKLLTLPGVDQIDPGDWRYFNSGVMLAYRNQNTEAFKQALEICHIPNQLGWIEQTPLQYALKKLGGQMFWFGESWNFIHPQTLGPDWIDMTKHLSVNVYHGAGEPDRLQWLARCKWR